MTKKRKIRTVGGDALGANPFATLDRSGLPEGEMKSPVILPEQKSVKKNSKGRVEVRREKAGRGGKTVTTLKDFPSHIPLKTLEAVTLELKKKCTSKNLPFSFSKLFICFFPFFINSHYARGPIFAHKEYIFDKT